MRHAYLTPKEFHGQEFNAFCQAQFDEARKTLKNFGKPKDEIDRFLIEQARITQSIFNGYLHPENKLEKIAINKQIAKKIAILEAEVAVLKRFMESNG